MSYEDWDNDDDDEWDEQWYSYEDDGSSLDDDEDDGYGYGGCYGSDDEDVDDVADVKQQTKETKMTKEYIPHIISGNSITVFINGVSIFPSSHLLYKDVCNCVKEGDKNKLTKLLTAKTFTGLTLRDDEVLWNGEVLNNTATKRLFEMRKNGFSIEPMKKFLENCQLNPYPVVVEKLYDFLESRGMPLTEDGCFLGYKYCNQDYYDSYTGKTYQFLPNTVVKAPKTDYCDLTGHECSEKGIHVGNFEYSGNQQTNGRRVMYVKVNPKDVLSVPHGSGAKKIRVWELEVLSESNGILTEEVVTEKGKTLLYTVGEKVLITYRDGDNKVHTYTGFIKNVGNVYLELEKFTKNKTKCFPNDKARLKISNIVTYTKV